MEHTKHMKMILDIDPIKSAIASIGSAVVGSVAADITLVDANTAFQHAAWTVAILAGIVSIINGVIKIMEYFKNKGNKNAVDNLE